MVNVGTLSKHFPVCHRRPQSYNGSPWYQITLCFWTIFAFWARYLYWKWTALNVTVSWETCTKEVRRWICVHALYCGCCRQCWKKYKTLSLWVKVLLLLEQITWISMKVLIWKSAQVRETKSLCGKTTNYFTNWYLIFPPGTKFLFKIKVMDTWTANIFNVSLN